MKWKESSATATSESLKRVARRRENFLSSGAGMAMSTTPRNPRLLARIVKIGFKTITSLSREVLVDRHLHVKTAGERIEHNVPPTQINWDVNT